MLYSNETWDIGSHSRWVYASHTLTFHLGVTSSVHKVCPVTKPRDTNYRIVGIIGGVLN